MGRRFVNWSPEDASGLVFWGTCNREEPDWCVYNPAATLINGQFEGAAGPPPAGWSNTTCTATRQGPAGSRQDNLGYVGRLTYLATASGYISQVCLAVGNWYRVMAWARGDGVAVPTLSDSGGTTHWTGTASTTWQYCEAVFQAGGTSLRLNSTTMGAGNYVEWDNVYLFPLNINQWTDLSGTTNHLVQATDADRPLWTASDESGYISTDGSSDYIKKTCTLNQPAHIFMLAKLPYVAGDHCPIGGDGAAAYVHWNGSATLNMYAGSDVAAIAGAVDGNAHVYEFYFNGASSFGALDGGTPTVCNPGAGNLAGISVGARGDATLHAAASYGGLLVFNALQTTAMRGRCYRYLKRLGEEMDWSVP